MALVIRWMTSESIGARLWKLNWPQMPHILRDGRRSLSVRGGAWRFVPLQGDGGIVLLAQIKSETAKHLRLPPPVHRHVIPAGMELPRAEGTVGFDPIVCDMIDHLFESFHQNGKAPAQQ